MMDIAAKERGQRHMASSIKTFLSYRNIVVLAFGNLTVMLGYGMFTPIMPVYLYNYLGATMFIVGLFTSIFALMRATLQPVMGRISDRMGRKKMIVPALFCYSIIAYMYSTATTEFEFLGYRGVQGAASSTLWPASDALIADTVPKMERAKALGAISMAYQVGDVSGFGLGALVAGLWGFTEVFYICAIFAVAGATISLLFLKEPPKVTLGEPATDQKLDNDPPVQKEADGGAVNKRETVSSKSGGRRVLGFLAAMNLTIMISFSMMEVLLSIIIYNVYKGTFYQMAVVYIAFGLIGALAAVLGGSVAERFGKRKILLVSSASSIAFWFSLNLANTLLLLAIIISVFVFIITFSGPATTALVAELTPPGKRGTNYGFLGASNDLGLVIGPIMGGLFLDYLASIGFDLWGQMQALFILNAVFASIATALVLIGVREPKAKY
jgi:MFS family permease